jgi:predicted negative regulator of RcsB-dependent stress response
MPPEPDDLGRRVDYLAESVNGLREAHEENTAELRTKQAKSDLALAGTRRQGKRLVVVAVVGFLVAVGFGLWIVRDARRQSAADVRNDIVNCLNTNRARADRQLRDEQLGETLIVAAIGNTPAPTQEEQMRRDLYVAQITANYKQKLRETLPPALQQRDCSEAAVTAPTLVGGESKPG